jgi:hypothetical protein
VTGSPRIIKQGPNPQPDVTDPRLNPEAGAPKNAPAAPAPEPLVQTVRSVEISKVYKGNVRAGQTIEVKEMGGIVDGITYKIADSTPLSTDNSYTLFLETYPDSPASLLNPDQGKYPLDAAGNVSSLPGNSITMTTTDLDWLAARKPGS